MGTGELNSGGVALLWTSITSRESLYSHSVSLYQGVLMDTGELNSGGLALLKTSIPSRESLNSRNTSPPGSVNGYW